MRRLLHGFFLLSALGLHAIDLPEVLPETPSIHSDGYWYISGGVAAIAPKISVGYRFQRGKFGGDISVTEATIPPVFFSQGLQINQLFYPKPDLKKEVYFGVSEGIHYVLGEYPVGAFWEASVGILGGYQFQTQHRRHFVELKVGVPLRISIEGAKYPVPVPSISYGVSF